MISIRRALFLALAVVLIPACDNSGSGSGSSALSIPGAGSSPVVLVTDGMFVDYNPASIDSESSNLEYGLLAMGFPVVPVADLVADWVSSLAGARAVLLPETEIGSLAPSVTGGMAAAMQSFVNSGGLFVTFRDSGDNEDVLNALFGFSLDDAGFVGPSNLTAAAAGTPFQGAAASLPYNDGSHSLLPGTLPAGSKIIYLDANSNGAVVMIPYGKGWIVWLAWDWYDAAPFGSQDNGWIDTLRRTMTLAVGGGGGER